MSATIHTVGDVEKLSEDEWNLFLLTSLQELHEGLDRIESALGGNVPRKTPLTLVQGGEDA